MAGRRGFARRIPLKRRACGSNNDLLNSFPGSGRRMAQRAFSALNGRCAKRLRIIAGDAMPPASP
jgi:hypothetical protein